MADVDTWPLWDNITCPALIVRGAESGILLAETAQEMTRRGPPTKLVEIHGVGHAPALMDPFQISTILKFLSG
jgi:pimeloyl-ACP methyl ester carboxylesterase